MRGRIMGDMQELRLAVSAADVSLRDLTDPDPDVRLEAVLDFAALLTAAKRVVLDA
jgi:hypothetical protein